MLSDPIADMLIRIKNASMVGKPSVTIPFSKHKQAVAQVLEKAGYLKGIKVEGKQPAEKKLVVQLEYRDGEPVVRHMERVSKPGCRIYVPYQQIPKVLSGYGLAIISTSQGPMSGEEAKKKKIGGEFIGKVW